MENAVIHPVIGVEKIADLRLKHLEMVQATVTRIANQSATLKNYCLTLVIAICGFAITIKSPSVLILAIFPIIVFAILDAQYLRIERRFRCLYDMIRLEDWSLMPSFEIHLSSTPQIKFTEVLFSWSIGVFYLPVLIALFAAYIFGLLVQ